MDFPLPFDDVHPIPGPVEHCLLCGQELHHAAVAIAGGSLWMSRDRMGGRMHDRMEAFLMLRAQRGGECGDLEIVRGVLGGQYEMRFCSSGCCRSFLNSIVDELEAQMLRKGPG
jgi:hypothetical protein